MAIPTFSSKEWQDAVTKLTLRAEDLPDAARTYADTVFVESLKASSNQIVFGRRGTGKTHLLRRVESEFHNSPDGLHVVPVLIDGSAISNQVDSQRDSSAIALTLYVEFMRNLTRELHDFIDHRIDPSLWDRITRGPQSNKAQKAVATSERLYRILKDVRPFR